MIQYAKVLNFNIGGVMVNKTHYSAPTFLNKEPYLSLWWMMDYKPTAFYIQVSEDAEHPIWLRFGDALEIINRNELESNPAIIESLMNSFRCNDHTLGIAHITR